MSTTDVAVHKALSALRRKDEELYRRALEIMGDRVNPLSELGIDWRELLHEGEQREEAAPITLLGGGGQITGVGVETTLGGAVTCQTINVNVGGPALVTISMWYPFGSVPGGIWDVAGPGSAQIQLYNNVFGLPTTCGQVVTITGKGKSGTFPVWVSYNP
jgi:hypothetical protein